MECPIVTSVSNQVQDLLEEDFSGKKDCWQCRGSATVKKRVSKLLPCGNGWQLSRPNCGSNAVITVRPSTPSSK